MARRSNIAVSAYRGLIFVGTMLQHVLLLGMRLYWGWQFFLTGKGKLTNIHHVADYFASLHIPMPLLNAYLAGTTECVGGMLLLIGLGSRLVAIPLIFTMCVAYATAEREALMSIFHDPDKFVSAAPFLFLLTALIVLVFGPGIFSIDGILKRVFRSRPPVSF